MTVGEEECEQWQWGKRDVNRVRVGKERCEQSDGEVRVMVNRVMVR